MTRIISKHRDALMGMAILWVLLHHSGINLPNPIFALKRSGYGGVDIFMFLSGLGCVVSLNRNRNTLEFYKRRFVRVYPHYIPILVIFIVLNGSGAVLDYIKTFLGNATGFSFWAMNGIRFNWYILAIPAFYIATPLFYTILQAKGKVGLFVLIAISLVATFCFNGTDASVAVSRFPIYILGMEAGFRLVDNDSTKNKADDRIIKLLIYCCGIAGLVCLALLYKFQDRIPTELYNVFTPCILTTPAIVVFLSSLFNTIGENVVGAIIIKCLSFVGKISLDLYLIHIVFFDKVGMMIEGSYNKISAHPASIRNILIWLAIILCFIAVSYFYSRIVDRVGEFSPLTRKQRQIGDR